MAAAPQNGKSGGKAGRGITVAVVIVLVIAFFAWLFNYLQPGTWRYYTDDVSMKRLARDVKPGFVLWENSSPLEVDTQLPGYCVQPAISPDGARMAFTKETAPGNTDLFMLRWNGSSWGSPEPIRALNSKFNETGPAFSDDGKFLFFSSDRPGGIGGYDIWVARWEGSEYAWPQPLSLMVNSKFDDTCPRSGSSDVRLFFSSNRPKKPLLKEEEGLSSKELLKKYAGVDWDIYSADRIPVGVTNRAVERALSILYSLRQSALTDETVMEKLGGNKKTEQAVDKGLAYLASTQDSNGCWTCSSGHEVASTALALLAFFGRGERHDKPCQYQQTVARGLSWLLSRVNKLTGDVRGGGNMYDQGIGTLGLVEAYGVTRDPDAYDAAQSAIYFIADSQNEEDGGWRYTPREPADMSVSGWVIMSLKSAELSGLHVPAKTKAGALKWMKKVSGGPNGGGFSYQGGGQGSAAMHATGFFCSQLFGLSANTPRAFEAVEGVKRSGVSVADVYYAYYGTLCSYQSQGPLWRQWNEKMQDQFLSAQQANGSWAASGPHGSSMGPSICTALITLCLQAHYRYVPLFGLGYEPPEFPTSAAVLSEEELPSVPEYDRAKAMDELNSPADDLYATPTRHGDFLFLASAREGGMGGMDLYRCRTIGRTNYPPENLGPAINSAADDTAPTLRAAGFSLIYSTTRDGKDHELYSSASRTVFQYHSYSAMPKWSWLWDNYPIQLAIIMLAVVALIGWALITGWLNRRRKNIS